MKTALTGLLLLFLFNSGFSQDSTLLKKHGPPPVQYMPCFSFNETFVSDYILGFSGGVYERKNNWSARLGFDFRPYFKTVTFQESAAVRQQYKEKDFYLHLTLEKEFWLKYQYPMLRPFVQIDYGMLWGNFKAFHKAPDSKWIAAPAAGLNLALNKVVNFKLGYQYFSPLLQKTPSRIIFQIMFTIDHD